MTTEHQPASAPQRSQQSGTAQRFVFALDRAPALPPAELNLLLGGKGANLLTMATELGLPVPPGFVISSDACRSYAGHRWPAGLEEELHEQMERLRERAGRRFGDPADPLLVSVRSGAAVSMPGMLDTVLNVGLNGATTAGLASASGDAHFAADCLRRLEQAYRNVLGLDKLPDDPWQQLRSAIEAVFRSWNSDRARAYRRHERISDELGTAVTVQAMVFGNRGADSGTGVLFTRNPATGEKRLYGDVMFNAQGEDVVAGAQHPEPVSVLGERLPAVAAELRGHAETLERHYADLCDIEFTIERGRLWLLQVRVGKRSPRAALRMAIEMADDPAFPLSRAEAVGRVRRELRDPPRVFHAAADTPPPLAVGLPASPGVASGAIATSSEAAERAAAAGQRVVLVRPETSPEDVGGMARSAGVLTASGGLASHAAVVARGWGIPAVVGAAAVRVVGEDVEIAGRILRAGEQITIDGTTGEVHAGELEGSWQVAPEAATLLEWAAELGIGLEGAEDDTAEDEPAPAAGDTARATAEGSAPAERGQQLTTSDVLRALLVKGLALPDQLAAALQVEPSLLQPLLDEFLSEGLAEHASGALRLSADGRLKALNAFDADRAAVGEPRAIELLEQFHAFDRRMKEIVTAWQIRDIAGEQVVNDHADAGYDAGVLERLAALDAEAGEWLAPLADSLRRFATYRARLRRAVESAGAGDQRFVASPRVDSYHGVWFELHEDLIRLSGRRRSDEVAAGRA